MTLTKKDYMQTLRYAFDDDINAFRQYLTNDIISTKFGDSPSIDAFARLRTSTPTTIFDSKQIFDDPDLASSVENQPLFFDMLQ